METSHNKFLPTSKRLLSVCGLNMGDSQDKSVVSHINQARHFTEKAQRALSKRVDPISDQVNSIMELAMLNRDVLHINVAFSPEIAALAVKVFAANSNYFGLYKTLFSDMTYLDHPKAFEHLQILEDLLIDMVAEAKDKLMGGC